MRSILPRMEFRQLLERLDHDGDLLRIEAEVDPDYELGALLEQAERRGKACWFERVKGCAFPAVGGLMTSPERHALSIGQTAEDLRGVRGYGALMDRARSSPLEPQTIERGPVSEVVLSGDQIDLTALPAPRFYSGDSHRFITAGIGIARDPDSGAPNAGFYRQPVIDKTRLSLGTGGNSNLARIYNDARSRKVSLPVAVVIGGPPALLIAAGAQMRPEDSDYAVAGALQGSPIELVQCQTSELMVPAQAEIVIEAVVDFSQEITHRMGEFGDQFGETTSPVATVTAITHRKSAVFHIIMGGMNREHNALGIIIFAGLRDELLTHLQSILPGVRDLHVEFLPRRSGTRAQLAVSIDKEDDAQPRRIIDEIFSYRSGKFPMSAILQKVVVVDPDVDIRNPDDIEWAIASRMNRANKTTVNEDRSPDGLTRSRFGIDATIETGLRAAYERPTIPAHEAFLLDDYLPGK
jgi:2,5-furandicarboxylate decarboxylase 1